MALILFASSIHVDMLIFIKNWEPINDFILFDALLLYLLSVLSIIRRVNNILQITIVINLEPTNFLSINSNINLLDLSDKLNCEVLVAQTIFYLVTWHL